MDHAGKQSIPIISGSSVRKAMGTLQIQHALYNFLVDEFWPTHLQARFVERQGLVGQSINHLLDLNVRIIR
jgi:hypothetical protein